MICPSDMLNLKVGNIVRYAGIEVKVIKVNWFNKSVTLLRKDGIEVECRLNSKLLSEVQ